MKKLVLIIGFFTVFACNDIGDCQLDPYLDSFGLKFTFLDPDEALDRVIVFDSIRLDGLGFFDLDTASVRDTLPSLVYFPIDITTSQSTYWFFTDSTDYYLTISYKSETYIYELNCDAGLRFFDLKIEDTNLDSVRVTIPELTKNATENVQIFF